MILNDVDRIRALDPSNMYNRIFDFPDQMADALKLANGWNVKPESFPEVGNIVVIGMGGSAIGGGSLPGETLPSWVLALSCQGSSGGPEEVMQRLRQADPPVVARIEGNRVLLDPRTVLPEEDETLLQAVRVVLPR